MGKAGNWFRRIFMGKKDDEKHGTHVSCCLVAPESPRTPLSATLKEKRRWSFRRSSAKAACFKDQPTFEAENEQKKHALAAVAAAALICLNSSTNIKASLDQEAAATRIQSCFRSYLAKKALCALRGIVKLQALVRGQLVRKQAFNTLRCMQALITAQDRARATRIRMVKDRKSRKSTQDDQSRGIGRRIKIEEMDMGEHSNHGFSMQIPTCIGHFEGSSFVRAQTSPLSAVSKPDHSVSYDDPMFPNYMSNTESSRAKVRSQSAPKSRPDSFERQTSRRKQSDDERNVRMHRSASQVGSATQNYQYNWPIELDKSTVPCKDSECGSHLFSPHNFQLS